MRPLSVLWITSLFCLNAHAIKPDTIYRALPSDYGIVFQQLDVATVDSFNVLMWVFDPVSPDTNTQTLIIAGGDAGNMSYLLPYAANLVSHGIRVVTFDYRGFGQSQSFRFNTGQYYCQGFENDLLAVVSHCHRTYNRPSDILALSLGTLVTLNAVYKNQTGIRQLVFDALVAEPGKSIKRVNVKKQKHLTAEPFDEEVFLLPDTMNCLVFSGTEDWITTTEDARSFQKKNTGCMVFVYTGGHLESARVLQTLYYNTIAGFINMN